MSTDTPSPRTTLRLRHRGRGNTLDRYVFTDREHARQWLKQPIIDPSKITLEPVEVGEYRPCRMCGGKGFHQTIRVVGDRLSAEEFLRRG